MPFPLALVGLGSAVAALGGWIGWRWYNDGEVTMENVIPFTTSDPDDIIEDWSAEHDIDPDLIRAVVQVESGGRHEVDGRPVIRLEVHKLQREAGSSGRKRRRLDGVFRRTGSTAWTGHQVDFGDGWVDLHPSGDLELHQQRQWAALALARQILGDEAAYRSASIGVGQVLGSNYKDAGEPSAAALFSAAKRGKGAQVRHMLTFIERNKGGRALRALQAGDVPGFVVVYNGAGQVPYYTGAIVRAQRKLAQAGDEDLA